MIFSLVEPIELIRRKFSTFTGVNVTLGMPDVSEPGLFLFPYNFLIDKSGIRNSPGEETELQTAPPYLVKCLLVAGSAVDYLALEKGLNFIYANPVLESKQGFVRVVLEDISSEELTSLFISAGATYSLSIAFEMRCSVR